MFAAILILLLLPITDVSRSRGMQFRPLSKWAFFVFVANFLILMQLGAKHVESPFIEFGQISTVLYFLYFTLVMYGVTTIENTFVDLRLNSLYTSTITKLDKMGLSREDLLLACNLILDKDLKLEKEDLLAISRSKNIDHKVLLINEAANHQYSNWKIESYYINRYIRSIKGS